MLFSSTGISVALGMLQSIFAARLLGVDQLGLLGTITVFSSTINRLFSFRMSELVVRYLGEYLPLKEDQKEPDRPRAAALVKTAGLIETLTSLLAFAVLLALSPLAARFFGKDAASAPLFQIYGLTILGSLVAETSTGVLQATNRFRPQAVVNLMQSLLTAGIIMGAYFLHGDIMTVLLAYLVGKLVLGIAPAVLALRALREILGKQWWKVPFSVLPPWRELVSFAVSTNLSATVNLLVRDSELLWVAFFLDTGAAGYYKIALAVVSLLSIPLVPLGSAVYPEISRLSAGRLWQSLRSLLRRVSLLSGAWIGAACLVLVFFGKWVILLYGVEYLPAYPALLVLLAGSGFADILFWNRPLLLSLGLPSFPLWANTLSGALKILLSFLVIPAFGYVGAAALLSGYFVLSVCLIVWRGFKELKRLEAAA